MAGLFGITIFGNDAQIQRNIPLRKKPITEQFVVIKFGKIEENNFLKEKVMKILVSFGDVVINVPKKYWDPETDAFDNHLTKIIKEAIIKRIKKDGLLNNEDSFVSSMSPLS